MRSKRATCWVVAGVLFVLATNVPDVLGQTAAPLPDLEGFQSAQQREKLELIQNDKRAYAAAIVARWESSARESGRFDSNYAVDLLAALVSLQPENLLAAGEATSYQGMMNVLATGRAEARSDGPVTNVLGSYYSDLVYTPVTPCRTVDTRLTGAGAIAAGTTRTFDVDGSNFTTQGGSATGCGIPYGVATAVTMTIVAVAPSAIGYLNAWALGAPPLSSVVTYLPGTVLSNTAIIPVAPGIGNDFSIFSLASSHVVVDVLGYYSAPVATALDCTNAASGFVAAPVNTWTAIDAVCPSGRTVTGGGHFTSEGSLGYPGVWLLSIPAGNAWRIWVDNQTNGPRNIQSWARCCRIPGR
jgi:hypothetical protein